IPVIYEPLLKKFWPGPLTLLFPWKDTVSNLLTGGTGTVGFRISPDPFAQMLLDKWKRPITATSANLSGDRPAETAHEVKKIFGSHLDYIIDGGDSPAGLCSTIVGYEGEKLVLIRQGKISFEEIIEASLPVSG
ncbi:MAG: L-threonylcarbamoyladenylate synthase, partial [Desulfopila sp.]|nr:L-threonylcarbamoyladenylate synthase [Desulfopila sp.]